MAFEARVGVPGSVVAAGSLVEADGVLCQPLVVRMECSEMFQERKDGVLLLRAGVCVLGLVGEAEGGVGGLGGEVFTNRIRPQMVGTLGEGTSVVAQRLTHGSQRIAVGIPVSREGLFEESGEVCEVGLCEFWVEFMEFSLTEDEFLGGDSSCGAQGAVYRAAEVFSAFCSVPGSRWSLSAMSEVRSPVGWAARRARNSWTSGRRLVPTGSSSPRA